MGVRAERRAIKNRMMLGILAEQNLGLGVFSSEALEAINRYPILAAMPGTKYVLTARRVLDSLPEDARSAALARLEANDTDVTTAITEWPHMPGHKKRLAADSELASLIQTVEQHSTPFHIRVE